MIKTVKCSFIFFINLVTGINNQKIMSHLLATSPEPPFVQIPGIKSSYNALIAWDTLNILAARLNFSLNITHPPDFLFGGFKNGQWDGIIGQLVRNVTYITTYLVLVGIQQQVQMHFVLPAAKEVDIGASLNAITYARYTAIDFTVPVIYDVTGILIPFPQEISKLTASIQPFSTKVWVAFFSSVLVVCFVLLIEARSRGNSCYKTFGYHVMWASSIITGQGTGRTRNRLALRITVATWCLTSVVFIYVYTGVLTSIIAVPKYVPIINSLEELAASSVVKPVTIKSTAVDDIMLNAKSGNYKLIGDTFREFPNETLVANTLVGFQRVLQGYSGFLEPKMSLLLLIENDRREHNCCRATLAKQTFYPRAFAYTLPKKSPIKAAFDWQILLLQQYGFTKYFQGKIVLSNNRCLLKNKIVRSKTLKFTLYHVSSAFLILITGYVVSFAVFTAENILKLIRNYITNKMCK